MKETSWIAVFTNPRAVQTMMMIRDTTTKKISTKIPMVFPFLFSQEFSFGRRREILSLEQQ